MHCSPSLFSPLFFPFWAAAPKGPIYGTTQGDFESPFFWFSISPFLHLIGWPSDPQTDLPAPLAVLLTLMLTFQALLLVLRTSG